MAGFGNFLRNRRLQVRILPRVFGKFMGGQMLGTVSVTVFSERSAWSLIGWELDTPFGRLYKLRVHRTIRTTVAVLDHLEE